MTCRSRSICTRQAPPHPFYHSRFPLQTVTSPPPSQVNEAAKACKLQPLPGDSKTLKAARQVFDK